jgi:Zn-dependent protease with chaperone function
MRFSATLHDRQLPNATPVTVRAEPGVLFLETDSGQIHDWTLGDLQSARALDDGSVILQSGRQFLEVKDPDFRRALDRSFPQNRLFRQSFFDRIGVVGCLFVILGMLLPIILLYLFVAPRLAERAAVRISTETERQIGDAWFSSLTAAYSIDTAQTRLVQQFYDSLGYGSDYSMRITVVEEPVVNAFAVPGGQIVIFDSILGIMDAPEQLAGLLAHEASHVQLKHSIRSIFRELANNLLFSLLLGDYGDLSVIIARQGDQLAGLSYSRRLELEADENGIRLMIAGGIPPRGMPDLFKKMQSALSTEGSDGVPNFLSTHPSLEERLQVAAEKIAVSGNVPDIIPEDLRRIWAEIQNRR